jgi:hypothetical protein
MREGKPKLRVGHCKQRPAVPRGETSIFDEVKNQLFQTQKTRGVANGCAVFTGFCGHFFLGQMKFAHQALIGAGFFDRVEVLALNILDEGYFERSLIGDFADDRGHTAQACPLRCAPSAFAGEELIARSNSSQDQRLNDAAYLDRLSELRQGLFRKMSARLIGTWLDQINVYELRARDS